LDSWFLVPKDYIWPVNTNLYLQAPTSLVLDAHSAGLEIFAADFANDEYGISYNYCYQSHQTHNWQKLGEAKEQRA